MSQWHGGKGSKRRPGNPDAYADNWDRIFSKKKDPLDVYNDARLSTVKDEQSFGKPTESDKDVDTDE